MKPTPGPWDIKSRHHVENETCIMSNDPQKDNNGFVVAHTYGPNHRGNAIIISLARELLEELENRLSQTRCGCENPACRLCADDSRTRALIARAKGC